MKKLVIALSICLVLVLAFCVFFEKMQADSVPVVTEPNEIAVRFEVNSVTFSEQKVTAGQLPLRFDSELVGGQIVGWKNLQNQIVDPFSTYVSTDTVYQAIVRPELSGHKPYLFIDSNGMIRPDAVLTGEELAQAMTALAAPGAEAYFPSFPDGSVEISWDELVNVLVNFFDSERITAAFPSMQLITRVNFAKGMNILLYRDTAEQFVLSEGHTVPTDITMDTADAAVILEASVEHIPANQGMAWAQLDLPTTYEPGFINIDGWLYYVKEDGYLLRDSSVGSLSFDANGRYTCGDAQLDETVAALLKIMIEQNPKLDRLELLRVVYDYCHQNYTYRRIYEGNPEYGETGWEIMLAKDMFESGKGNCYSYSSIFWALSRGLGYETRAISGKCLSDEQPHSWCILELDGEDYIFDPQWQYNYTERGIDHYDMFKIPMDQIYIWLYQWDE